LSQVRELLRHCAPLTLSGSLLALLIALPRLANESTLNDPERALFGLAQILSAALAILFNAVWLYELPRMKELARTHASGRLARRAVALSAAFFVATVAIGSVAALAQDTLLGAFRISAAPSLLLPSLLCLLGMQHCISVVRDQLKLSGRYWTEVLILVASLGVAGLSHLGALALGAGWIASVATICLAAAASQVLLTYLCLGGAAKR
jgi:hypothetical protein